MTNRQYPDRPFCGVGVVVWRDDDVLLVRRGRAPRKGDWSIPGGLQELGETVAETALREVLEETGVTVRLTDQLGVVDSVRRDDSGRVEYHYTLIEFAAEWVAGEPAPNDDVDRAQWVALSDLDRYALWDETRRIIALSQERRRG
ncbi:MAG: NUDIX hydrolase [Alphaproteobacteria bacterium]|nr:NUDIX hydrolase [Alphaproteobacteria bacterium]